MTPLDTRVQRLEDQVAVIQAELVEIQAEIAGPLIGVARLPLRDRLHQLESDRASAQLATTALDAAKALRDSESEKHRERRSSTWRWAVTAAIALLAVLGKHFGL